MSSLCVEQLPVARTRFGNRPPQEVNEEILVLTVSETVMAAADFRASWKTFVLLLFTLVVVDLKCRNAPR